MEQVTRHRETPRQFPAGRMAIAALALGGLTATSLAVETAGAKTSHKSLEVSTTRNATFGTILVSGNRTLYTLSPGKTACTAACLKVWPELTLPKGVTKAKAGTGLKTAKLSSVKRHGGTRQVTYAGKALYRFVGDTKAGQANGNVVDAWGKWSVVVTAKPAASATPSTSGSTTTPTTSPAKGSSTSGGKSSTTTSTTAGHTTTTTRTPTTSPTTSPPATTTPTTSPPPTTTTPTTQPPPPTTTTTSPGGGGVGF
jgi:predicted lipoprotein with Yx(FWY)xxD motif